MLNALFLPFASMPATIHYEAPSEIEGFTLHYDEHKLNVRVDEAEESDTIEIEIEAYNAIFGPHLVGITKDRWAIEFGSERSAHTATIVDGQYLLFTELPNEAEAKELLQLIDRIIRANQRHRLMINDFMDQYGEALC